MWSRSFRSEWIGGWWQRRCRSIGRCFVTRLSPWPQKWSGCSARHPRTVPGRTLRSNIGRCEQKPIGLRVRSLHRRGAPVDISLDGLEHLEAALVEGNGAILWWSFFCSSHIPKQALGEAGYPLVHLSDWDHGARGFNLPGLRLFAPLWIRAEVRHLEERVVKPRGASLDYMRRLQDALQANMVLSIFGNLRGRAPIRAELLGTQRRLASGAPSLAHSTGAGLLTMYAVRTGSNRFRVVIERPLPVDRGLDRRAFVEAAVAEYVRRVDATVRRHPDSWYRWSIFRDHAES